MIPNMGTYSVSLKIPAWRLILKICLFALLLSIIQIKALAQDIQKRPTIGLVLSGGGAHGIAHLGVIKVMEEAGLRPDYITGVSMGSIVGGMYSIGYTADSIYKILKKINWELILSNKIPENKVIFLEKNNFYNSIISLPISARKLTLPSGLINGQLIESALNYYTWPAADIPDFSKLPIPFMCIGTDLITYTKVDLKRGYLADAIRASFAVPSIFTPIKIDTMLLVDGGLIRNFAASEAKEMGADILIGSYTGFRAYKEDDLQSVAGIIKQLAFFRALEDFQKEKEKVDILIIPKTGKLPKTDFDNVDTLFRRGYEAAIPYREYFKKLADSLNLIGKQEPLVNILDKQSYTFDKIEVTGNHTYSDYQILGVLEIDPGEKIGKTILEEKIELLYGKAWFEKVKYRIEPRNDSLILKVECEEKPKGIIYGSGHYDNSLRAGIIIGLSVKNLLTKSSVINMNSFIAQFYRFEFNSVQFINRNQKFGFSADFYSDNTLLPMLGIKGEKRDVISRNFVPGVSVTRSIGLNQMMRMSLEYENSNLILQHASELHIKNLSYNFLTATYNYQVNSLDTKHFPNRGIVFNISASASGLLSEATRTDTSKTVIRIRNNKDFSSERFYTFYGHLKYYFSTAGKITFSIGGDALFISTTDSVSSQNNFYLLGGIESLNKRSVSMIGYHSNEITVKKMAGIRTDIDIEMFNDIHLEIMANIAAIREANREDGFSFLTGFGLDIGYMSIIGPLKIGIMHGNNSLPENFNKIKGFISFGYNF
jgi:NTE family protein